MTVTKSIGTAGGRDYSTIAAFEAALPATLTDAYVGECYNDSEFTVTASIVFSGFTTTSTNTVTLTAAAGQSFVDNANAQTNALRYNASNGVGVRKTNGYGNVFDVQVDYVTIKRLQAAHSGGNGTQVYGNSTGGASPVARNTDQCLFQRDSSGNNSITKLRAGTHTNSVWIQNNNSTAVGCQLSYPTVVALANLTLVASSDKSNTGTAFSNGTGSPSSFTLTNVAVFGFSGGFASSNDSSHGTANYCATDQSSIGLAGGTGNLTSKTYANQFQGTASTGLDFRLKSGADLIDAGTADTTDIPSAVDIVGTSRPQGSAWDIGAWEFAVASGVTYFKTLTASFTSSGVFSKQVGKVLTAGAAISANVGKAVAKRLDGLFTASGAFDKLKARLMMLTASFSANASIATVLGLLLVASAGMSASLARSVRKTLIASVAASATMSKLKARFITLTASFTSHASVSIGRLKLLTAAFNANGSIAKGVSLTLRASFSVLTTLTKVPSAIRVWIKKASATASWTPKAKGTATWTARPVATGDWTKR